MKKQLVTLFLGLATVAVTAQKKELKELEKAVKKEDFSAATTAINVVESVIANADDKSKAKFYFLKGQVFAAKKDYKKAAEVFNQLMSFEKETGDSKYTNEAAPMLGNMAQEVSKKAIDFYNNDKNYKKAAENFYLTYLLSPKDTSFVFNAAVSATYDKDYASAVKYYKELLKIGYTGIETQYTAINKETGEEEPFPSKSKRDISVKAGQHIKPVTKVTESKKADIVKNIALLLKEQGKTEEAIEAIKDARAANPKDLNLVLAEADLYVQLERMDKFGELMEEAVALDPNNPNLYYNLGVVNQNQQKVEEAKKYYKKAIELKPDYADAYMNLAVSILAKDQQIVDEMNENLSNEAKYNELEKQRKELYKEVLPYLKKADELNRNLETVRTLMNIYEMLEISEKAEEYRALYKDMR